MRWDCVVIGGGHNALVAATLLARAGRRVVVLERRRSLGGAAVSERPWPGVDARLSRYAYLVSLLPRSLAAELDLDVELRRRPVPAYPPRPVRDFDLRVGALARALAPTLLEPLRSAEDLRARVGDDRIWSALCEKPLGAAIEEHFDDDVERGTVLTDGLIGTFTGAHDASLLANRCFLYHVVGNGTGDWDVPVGGMGAVSAALERAARAAGVELRTGVTVVALDAGGGRAEVRCDDGSALEADTVLCGAAPSVLAELLGETPSLAGPRPEGAQLKVNMLLRRLPRVRDGVSPEEVFGGTCHVRESYSELESAYRAARAGRIPEPAPCELYCHSLTDPTILGAELRAAGAQTLTLFGLHMPARLFDADHDARKAQAVAGVLDSLASLLAEPLEPLFWRDADGGPCIEARTPQELEAELALPGGHIFHRNLSWPWAEHESEVGTWGTETRLENVWLCGAGARRGGGVSGIPGHNAAKSVLERTS